MPAENHFNQETTGKTAETPTRSPARQAEARGRGQDRDGLATDHGQRGPGRDNSASGQVRAPGWSGRWWRHAAVVLCLGIAGLAPAQEKAREKEPAPAGPTVEIRSRLEATTKELETLRASLPPDAPAVLRDRVAVLEATAEMTQRHLQSLEMVRNAEARRAQAEKANKDWTGPDKPPPYSWIEADRYRTAILAAQDALNVAGNFREIFKQSAQTAQQALVQAEAAVRRARDARDKAQGDQAKEDARLALLLEEARLRLMGEEMETVTSQIQSVDQSIAAEKSRLELATRQRLALGDRLTLSPSEVDNIAGDIAKRKSALDADRKRAITAGRGALNLKVAESGAPTQADVLGWLSGLEEMRELLWRGRLAWVNAPDAEAKVRARRDLADLLTRPTMWKMLFEARMRNLKAAVFETEARKKEAPDPASFDALQAEFKVLEDLLQQGVDRAANLESFPAVWEISGDKKVTSRTFGEWLAASRLWTTDTVRAIWNLELYYVQESVEVDGRTISGKRAVTVGKVMILLVILVAGYLVLRAIARHISRKFQQRFGLESSKAEHIHRWLMGLGMLCLGLYALNYVSIPLTAFAFLGGALAIGVGVGTQNVIKNFVCGLLIHMEKPFRVGDVLEAGPVNGTVVNIGMRSSVVRHWDGIETLIPNSVLLENNVTNWTYNDRHLRHSVRVGVAYGSNPETVAACLQRVAAAHTEVLKTPVPFVLFEDFAESSLVFGVYFWIDMAKSGRTAVASDLRFAIEREFRALGISMAFPQRDMHLAAGAPLEIRVLPTGPT